ncbi:putative xanthine dehydrogenase accessory factor [Peptoanaerobacter stomatis]|uniref:Putative xanthine dehydrogenase accessory factor n=1 Tax=Peptoanaerobacter stomatis TaxID=796937 RepID=J6HHZ9_9FIRM|nr:XdhC/CoxI family protein [Peptoanaerobacter stomatis]EJU24585.1 putative xanthine dehydrogenase accessory factor [Peptoanaerobacter stomatis]NWO25829.1 XdhC family protein [Peptostreptococcaceae bacterium oral taxon 081]
MDANILKFIDEKVEDGKKAALILLTQTSGSTPRKAGSIMALCEDGSRCGTVGGGNLENQILISAEEAIEKIEDREFEHILTEKGDLGMICGGEASGYIKVFYPRNKLLIIGAGHVGKALYDLAVTLDFDITVMDDRQEYANKEAYPDADIVVGEYEDVLPKLEVDKFTSVVIVTRGHKYDKEALKAFINKDTAYIGMIGSRRKIKGTLDVLKEDALYKDNLSKLYAPIGLDIGSNLPSEIALGIMCEIVLCKNGKKPEHMRDLYRQSVEL